jgi:hypothetical protein
MSSIGLPALSVINRSHSCLFQALVFIQCPPYVGPPVMSSVHWSFCNVIRTLVLLQCHPYIGPPSMSAVHWSSCSVIRALALLQSHPYIGPPALLSVYWSSCSVIRAMILLQYHPSISSVHWSSCIFIHAFFLLHCHPCLGSPVMSSLHRSSCIFIHAFWVLLTKAHYITLVCSVTVSLHPSENPFPRIYSIQHYVDVSAYSTFQSVVCPSAGEYAAGFLIAANLQCNLSLSLVHRCIYVSLHRIGSQAEPYSMTRGEAPYAIQGLGLNQLIFYPADIKRGRM